MVKHMFMLMIMIIVTLTACGTVIAAYISRIGYYFFVFEAISLASISYCYSKKNRSIVVIILVVLCGFFWFQDIVVKGYQETYPYMFFWE